MLMSRQPLKACVLSNGIQISQIQPVLFVWNKIGKYMGLSDENILKPPVHPRCRYNLISMKAIVAGNATKDEKNGADFWIKYYEELPDYYISEQEIRNLGWKRGKSPKKFAPGKIVTRGIYQNRNGRLPDIKGRVWYEADINYYEGKRNKHRLLWLNDGLIFVTYDHYEKFYKIIREENTYGKGIEKT